jgi:centromere/kinetochore protein ZW10
MKEIEDKWVDGCGPLAMAFNGDEVRRLVRALFQNTDHRAAFLASIK